MKVTAISPANLQCLRQVRARRVLRREGEAEAPEACDVPTRPCRWLFEERVKKRGARLKERVIDSGH
jgi:hypothetical protein